MWSFQGRRGLAPGAGAGVQCGPEAADARRTMGKRQRILLEYTATRDQAEALLRGLLDARAESERRLLEQSAVCPERIARVFLPWLPDHCA